MHKIVSIDLRTRLREFYNAKTKPAIVDVPKIRFVAIDGTGSPESPDFADAVGALYGFAYTAKFRLKKEGKADFKVMPLEGLWFSEGAPTMTFDELQAHRESWTWTLLIAQPDVVDASVFRAVRKDLEAKGKPAIDRLRLETIKEGPAVQILHVGPYAEEPHSLGAMHAFAAESGYELHGRHHEIYLGDPRRSAPEKLKTILRHPVKKAR